MTISEWRQKLSRGEVSSLELVDQHIARISNVDSALHAFLEGNAEKARDIAKKIESEMESQELTELVE